MDEVLELRVAERDEARRERDDALADLATLLSWADEARAQIGPIQVAIDVQKGLLCHPAIKLNERRRRASASRAEGVDR
ncbi:hypothetical protein [Patulibacter minatonensis]|uniref:hypothetical protein n=1 Tax=Patulibacter minatonensis TaxID=298163 RepID=UPI0012F71799|nr:hypothetical protein [Patulibacter minatonensis]